MIVKRNNDACLQVAMRLLEKDIHDKQDTLVSLRRQLEDIKKLNLELHSKLQVLTNIFLLQCFWNMYSCLKIVIVFR